MTGPALQVEVLAADQVEVVLPIIGATEVVRVLERESLRTRHCAGLEHLREWRVGLEVVLQLGGLIFVELSEVIEGVNKDLGALHRLDRRLNQQDELSDVTVDIEAQVITPGAPPE